MKHWLDGALNLVERAGNRLPDPASLFVLAIIAVLAASAVCATAGLAVLHPLSGETIQAYNLFSPQYLRQLLVEMPQTFAGFPPLGTVLLVMLGIGVADKSGLIGAALQLLLDRIPNYLLSAALVFAGVMSSLAADAGYVVLIPLGAVLFNAAGRHPLAGIAATFAGVSAGYTANLLLTTLDPLLAGITQAAAQLIDPDYTVLVTANYYLMVALVPVLTLAGAFLTEKLIEPRLQQYAVAEVHARHTVLNAGQRRGLIYAAIALVLIAVLVAAAAVPQHGVLRDEQGTLAPFYHSMVALMFMAFFIAGLTYGITVKRIRNDRDVINMTAETMADMGHYIVLAFLAAHLIVLFKWSNLGLIVAVGGAEAIKASGVSGPMLIVLFIFASSFINLFIGSASAKWALIAPVFVPMMMLLGYSPELTQAAYRIGDSATNILTPLMPYFPLVIVFARKYLPGMGIGTLVAMMLPYSIGFGLCGTTLLLIWLWLGLPLGPGV